MDSKNITVEIMWENYLESIGENLEDTNKKYDSWHFCDNKKSADELAILVKKGIKRATTSLNYWYETKGEEAPKVGNINIIENWDKKAQCIIQTKKVRITPFNEVSEEFARREGEGDKTLKYWQDEHRDFFIRELKDESIDFSEDMLVVCEEFELIYKG